MINQMIFKFEKYWSKFSIVLAIVVVLDPRYKLCLIKYYYMKIYRVDSKEYDNVNKKDNQIFYVVLRLQAPQLTVS